MEKSILRKQILSIRDDILDRKEKSEKITDQIKMLDIFKKSSTIMTFVSYSSEVNTHKFIQDCISLGKTVCIPHITDMKNKAMIATKISGIDELIPSYKGILQADDNKILQIDKNDIDIVITPCVCCDIYKYRVGYGGGFYDRFFEDMNAYKICICYDECIVDKIDIDEYDKKVDMVITDKRVFL